MPSATILLLVITAILVSTAFWPELFKGKVIFEAANESLRFVFRRNGEVEIHEHHVDWSCFTTIAYDKKEDTLMLGGKVLPEIQTMVSDRYYISGRKLIPIL